LARDDDWVRAVSARELRPIVVIGTLAFDGEWQYLSQMLMHPDAKARPLTSRAVSAHVRGLNEAMAAIGGGEPFVRSRQWRARAERRKYEGDAADSVVCFQIAAETLVYELFSLLLVDEGLTSREIDRRRGFGLRYKTLLTRELGSRLRGTWDLTDEKAPAGRYWNRLYRLRNRIVHAGYLPHDGDAEQAETAYTEFDQVLEERLRVVAKTYPRTLLAKVGKIELEQRGWVTKLLAPVIAKVGSEETPFYLPRDLAGR
jgi:hypothetical protein